MKRNRLALFALIALVLAVISRCFQLLSMTEATTGFILKEYTAFSTAITVFIFIVILSICLAASLTKIKGFKNEFSYPLLISSTIAAVAIVFEPITQNYYSTLPTTVRAFAIALSVASGAVLILFAMSKTGYFKFSNIFLCIPVFCQFLRLMLAFVSTSKIVTVNDNLYELGFLCAALMFFVYFAQAHTNSGNEKTPIKALVTGVCAASFAVVSAAPKIVALIIKRSELLYNGTTSAFADIALGIFVFIAALEVEE